MPSLAGGGAERVFVTLANEFVSLGCEVDLALARAAGPYLDEVGKRVRIVDFRASGVLAACPALVRYLRSERPDTLLSALDHANVVAILARFIAHSSARCVISVRSVPTAATRLDRSLGRWATLQLGRVFYRFSDRVIANSQSVALDLEQSLGVARSRISVVYNPLDTDRIVKLSEAAVDSPGLGAVSVPIVLAAGSLARLKDFPTLIRAFAVLHAQRDCRLVILGEGPDRGKLEALIRQEHLQSWVDLPGFVANPFAWMRHAAVFVSSSLTEGCPNALMQALACGVPVVSTDCAGGTAEVLQAGKWGRLVPVANPQALAQAIANTLDATGLPDVRLRARDFSIGKIAREYLRILLPLHACPAWES